MFWFVPGLLSLKKESYVAHPVYAEWLGTIGLQCENISTYKQELHFGYSRQTMFPDTTRQVYTRI